MVGPGATAPSPPWETDSRRRPHCQLALQISQSIRGTVAALAEATYTQWDASANSGAGAYVTVGNQSFTVYAEDRNSPGSGIDRIWLAGPGALAMPGTPATAGANTAPRIGGNLSVPHKAPGGKP